MKTMKFITLCASVLLAASAARAQHTVGVFGGFGTGTARFYPAQETKSVGGRFSGGFSWRYYSATRFVGCVGVDLEFLQRGFAYAPFASTTENEADYVYYTRKLNSFVAKVDSPSALTYISARSGCRRSTRLPESQRPLPLRSSMTRSRISPAGT